MVRSQCNTRASQPTSDVRKEKRNCNITPSLTLRLRRRLKVARLRSARGPSNVAPTDAVNDSVSRDVFIDVYIVLVRNGRAVPVSGVPRLRVRQMGAARRGGGNRGTSRRPGRSSGGVGRGTRRGLGSSATKGTAVWVVAGGPAGAVGALIDGALVPIMPKAVTRVTCLVITRVSGREGDLGIASGPPRLYSLEDMFFIRYQGRG